MKRILLTLTILVMVIAVVYAADAQKIVDDMVKNYSDFEKSVDDLTMTNTMSIEDEDGNVNIDMTVSKKGEKFRFDIMIDLDEEDVQMNGINTVVIYDGNEMWMMVPIVGKQKVEDEEDMEDYNSVMEMFWWNNFGTDPEIISEENINGTDCYVIEFEETDEQNGFSKIWVSKKDNILIKAVSDDDGGYVLFKEYKDVYKGYKLPFSTVFYTDDVEELSIVLKTVKVNSGINDDIFDIDKVEVDNSGIENFLNNMFTE